MIVLIIGLVCFIQLVFSQPVHAQTEPDLDYLQTGKESGIQIESWMTDPGYWNNGEIAACLIQETDPEVTIEDWMTNFSIPVTASAQDEIDYEIESWMFDETHWLKSRTISCQ